MSEKSEKSKKIRKKLPPVCGDVEILPLAEIVEQTGWSPEELVDRSTWGYLRLMCADEPRSREFMIEDYLEHRK